MTHLSQTAIWLTLIGMALATYLTRVATMLALRGDMAPWLRRWLGYVPVAVFTALALPPLLLQSRDGARVRALGTKFDVRHDTAVVKVTLVQGRVEVRAGDGQEAVLSPGMANPAVGILRERLLASGDLKETSGAP
ncbi:MAG TPA: AzlD domain-containing protein, partial [Kouleothrix sp.]|nr:AzlD domain-containing protein [Kouleothrix sp.]